MAHIPRRYLITGAASGIGRSVAALAAAEGAALCLVDINEQALAQVADEVRAHAQSVATVAGDLADPGLPARAVAEAAEAMGGIDVLVSNAGFPVVSPISELSIEGFDRSIAVNARATWLLGKAALPWLQESGGAIVVTNSACGHFPAPPLGAYGIAKAGLLMITKQMALEWGPLGVRVNSVSPGPTMTGVTEGMFNDDSDPKQRAMREYRESFLPLRKLGRPQEVASAILFLAGPGASQITGIDIKVDGGLSLVLMPAAGGGTGREQSTSETYEFAGTD